MVSERPAQQKILVAVDFGTTFSGVAWSRTGEAGAQNIIQHWPDKDTIDSDLLQAKTIDYVPTTIKYRKNDYRWGYQIEHSEQRYEWFKLDLDPSKKRDRSSLAKRYPISTKLPLERAGHEISPAKLATDYLKALHRHTETMLLRTVTEAVLRRTPREYIITVPAVWTEVARELTADCAVEADMGPKDRLHLVSEPEAAALYAFGEMKSFGLEVNDTFVLCDAGGGTVDLISYTVISVKPILRVEEAAPGSGGVCGSTFLNRIFAEYLNDKFDDDDEWNADKEILATAMEHFETKTKINFNGTRGDSIPVHGVAAQPDIKRGRLQLTKGHIKEIFKPVVGEIIDLIREQIQQTEKEPDNTFEEKKKVKLVLLVGGFGNSFYLRSKISDMFSPKIDVKVAPNSQTAVVRGALMKGLAEVAGMKNQLARVRVETRKARKHYGTECFTDYKPRKWPDDIGHSPERRERLSSTGGWHVQYMRWFLKKGDTTRESEPATFQFQTDKVVSEGTPKEISIDIYCHPDHLNVGAPKYRTHDVVKLGSITADIRDIEPRLLKEKLGNDGKQYYVLNFDIEMKCFAARIEFTPVFLYGDDGKKRFSPMKIKYD